MEVWWKLQPNFHYASIGVGFRLLPVHTDFCSSQALGPSFCVGCNGQVHPGRGSEDESDQGQADSESIADEGLAEGCYEVRPEEASGGQW